MKRKIKKAFLEIFLIVLFPYVFTIIFFTPSILFQRKNPNLQIFIIAMLEFNGSSSLENEAIKAESIIYRTNIYKELIDGKKIWNIAYEMMTIVKRNRRLFLDLHSYNRLKQLVQETEQQVLLAENTMNFIPYFECSAGKTRDGMIAFGQQEYSYLKAVDSQQDKKSADYLTEITLSREQFPVNMKILQRDEAGYVLKIQVGDQIMPGEIFAKKMELNSSNFSLQENQENIRIFVLGKGHGLGYSKFGGNVLAKKGYSCKKILKKYFPEMQLEKKKLYDRK